MDLDVRERSDADARSVVGNVVARLGSNAGRRIFVKIDSTLRGPIAGLVEGALDASGLSCALVAPAFPEQGRHIRQGRLVVDGEAGPSLVEILGSLPARVVDSVVEAARCAVDHPDWLLVGSAGLARRLAPPPVPASITLAHDLPVLVVAGSPTSITRAQLDRVPESAEVVVFATPPTDARDAGDAAAALAGAVAKWANRYVPRAVVLTGGATAREVSHRLGATGLRLRGEVAPGIPVGTMEAGVWHGVTVVTKAGGFGGPETLLDVVRALGVSSLTGA
jgi:uncharacterized protein YgbK (DUF1537 family)